MIPSNKKNKTSSTDRTNSLGRLVINFNIFLIITLFKTNVAIKMLLTKILSYFLGLKFLDHNV